MINENMDYLQAGSPFPDWGFACEEDAAANADHWPSFVQIYV